MPRRPWMIVVAAALLVATVGSGLARPSPPAAAQVVRKPPVYLMGDSTMLIMWYYPESQAVIGDAYQYVPDFESCRRIITPSCRGRFHYVPPNVIETMRAQEGRLGELLVIMAGYDDANIEPGIHVVMQEARRQGVKGVLWLTYTTASTYVGPGGAGYAAQYAEHNRDLYRWAQSAEYPDLYVADWDTYSQPHRDWFASDGIHMTRSGAFALAQYLRDQMDRLYAGPFGRCANPDARRDALVTAAPLVASGGVTPVAPTRLLDTRTGDLSVEGGQGVTVEVPPSVRTPGTTGAWVNVTGTQSCGPGYLAAGPCPTDPGTSTVNYRWTETRAGLALAPLDADGRFCVRTYARSDIVVDLFGLHGGGAPLGATTPERVLDTRGGPPVPAGTPVAVDVRVPSAGTGVFVNLTVTEAAGPAYGTAWPAAADGSCSPATWPGTSNVNVSDGGAHPNAVLVAVGGGGRICVMANADAHLIVDRLGYAGAGRGPLTSQQGRLLDTRNGAGPVAAASVTAVPTGAPPGRGVLVNLTATEAAAGGYLSLLAPDAGGACPAVGYEAATSVVNYTAGGTRANLALATTGAAGQVCVYSYAATQLVVDLVAP